MNQTNQFQLGSIYKIWYRCRTVNQRLCIFNNNAKNKECVLKKQQEIGEVNVAHTVFQNKWMDQFQLVSSHLNTLRSKSNTHQHKFSMLSLKPSSQLQVIIVNMVLVYTKLTKVINTECLGLNVWDIETDWMKIKICIQSIECNGGADHMIDALMSRSFLYLNC